MRGEKYGIRYTYRHEAYIVTILILLQHIMSPAIIFISFSSPYITLILWFLNTNVWCLCVNIVYLICFTVEFDNTRNPWINRSNHPHLPNVLSLDLIILEGGVIIYGVPTLWHCWKYIWKLPCKDNGYNS